MLVTMAMLIVGCASPLKSDDPATRLQAVSELSDSKELMLIAMNIGVYTVRNLGVITMHFSRKRIMQKMSKWRLLIV
jgi:hypothetical protein